eukprot:3438141-Amphidinium_carterae.2
MPGGGDPDDRDPPDDHGDWNRRRDRDRDRDKKPTKEDVISKIASQILPKLEVKNAHDISALDLKVLWDTWLNQVSHCFNLWSTVAANTFRQHLNSAQERHDHWTGLPHLEKLQSEKKYTYGLGQLPPVQAFLVMQAMPRSLAEKLEAYGQYMVPDILFLVMKDILPNEDNLRLQMSEEINRVPLDKSTITFSKANTILEKWIQKYTVARKYKAHIEPEDGCHCDEDY